jgi:excisionase family DNA binding protein
MSDEVIAYRPDAAAAALGLSQRHISRLIVEGKLKAKKLGKRTLIDAASVHAFFESLPGKTGPQPLFKKAEARR